MSDIIDLTINSDKESYDSEACFAGITGMSSEGSSCSGSELREFTENRDTCSVLDMRSVVLIW